MTGVQTCALPIFRQSFSPQEYGKAITAAENYKLGALIIDSASHEWEGAGGVLDMAAANQAAANLQSAQANAEATKTLADRYRPLAQIEAISSGVPRRFTGIVPMIFSSTSSRIAFTISVAI